MGKNCAVFRYRKPSSFRKFLMYFGLFLASSMPGSLMGHLTVIDSIHIGGRPGQLAIVSGLHKLYAVDSDSNVIYVIDLQSSALIDSLLFPRHPDFLVADPHQKWLFVAVRSDNSGLRHDLYRFNCINDALIGHTYQGLFRGKHFCIDSTGHLYIPSERNWEMLLKLSEVDLITVDSIYTGYFPILVVADWLTPTVYTARYRINVVLAVDTEIDTPVRALAVWRDPVSMCGCGSPILYIVHSESDTISVVDMQSLQTKKLIILEGIADHINCNPGLNRAYAAMHDARKVAVIDGYTYEVAEYVELNGEPSCIAVDETTDRFYVSCPDDGKIYVLEDTP